MEYVIGVDAGANRCVLKAKDLQGRLIAQVSGRTVNHAIIGKHQAHMRINALINALLASFSGNKADCRCIVAGSAGLDSPNDYLTVESFYDALCFPCPIFCINDGSVALYVATAGVGLVTIAGTGSIVVGRNAEGKMTRSGGHSILIAGEEGSARWIALNALHHMSKWVDESVPRTPLVDNMIDYFNGFDANKLSQCIQSLRRKAINPELAKLVYRAADQEDAVAQQILRDGAGALFSVAQTVVKKLQLDTAPEFLAGLWGSVFEDNRFFLQEYEQLFRSQYPQSKVVTPQGDTADGAVQIALDYLRGKPVSFLNHFYTEL